MVLEGIIIIFPFGLFYLCINNFIKRPKMSLFFRYKYRVFSSSFSNLRIGYFWCLRVALAHQSSKLLFYIFVYSFFEFLGMCLFLHFVKIFIKKSQL